MANMRASTMMRMDTMVSMGITINTITIMGIIISMGHPITLLMDLLMDRDTNTVLLSGSAPKKQKISSYLSPITIPSERKSSLYAGSCTDAEGMLGNILPLPILLVLDSIISLLYRSSHNGSVLWDCLPLARMRIFMRLVLLNHRLGYMMGWVNWEFGSIL
jgi:hypothetical protein